MRTLSRLFALTIGLTYLFSRLLQKKADVEKSKILVLNQLLVGDNLLLIPLLRKIALLHPESKITLAIPDSSCSLFGPCPYVSTIIPWNEKSASSTLRLLLTGPYRAAYSPYEFKMPIYAFGCGAKNIVSFTSNNKFYSSFVTERPKIQLNDINFTDISLRLVHGINPLFKKEDWLLNSSRKIFQLRSTYILIHVSASNPNRRWTNTKWQELINEIINDNSLPNKIVITGISSESNYTHNDSFSTDPVGVENYIDRLSLSDIAKLIDNALVTITLDTGVAHLCKNLNAKHVTIYGQGNDSLHGPGTFWPDNFSVSVSLSSAPCRNMKHFFEWEMPSITRCDRNETSCPSPLCQNLINTNDIIKSARILCNNMTNQIR